MSDFDEKLTDLQVCQRETYTLIGVLKEKLDKHLENDDDRYQDLLEFKLQSSKHFSEISIIIKDLKSNIDKVTSESIPNLDSKQCAIDSTVKAHGWLLKSIIGITVLAVLGGTITSLSTCNSKSVSNNISIPRNNKND
jgi:hypothetical protein